jgi:hypothetical protein
VKRKYRKRLVCRHCENARTQARAKERKKEMSVSFGGNLGKSLLSQPLVKG